MPCRYGSSPDHRVRVELIEADLEIGFNLMDLAGCNPADSSRLVADAEEVFRDLLARVKKLEPSEGSNFLPLITELRRAIDLAAPNA
jgi:hypothetical protein